MPVHANVLGEVAFVEARNERFKEYMPGRRLLRSPWVARYVQMGYVSLIKKQLCCFGLDSSKQHIWMLREAILSNLFFPLLGYFEPSC